MLVKCLDYLRNKGAEWQSVQVFGQEVNGLTSSIARMNLYLNGVEDFRLHVQIRWSILHSWMAAIFVSSTLFWQILLIQSKNGIVKIHE